MRDDLAGYAGTLMGWSLVICPEVAPACPAGTVTQPLLSTDFEANNGGFTHSGTADEWGWGTPSFAPIATCASGTRCWKTDLAGTYNASANQSLLTPALAVPAGASGVLLSWAQKYQLESAALDRALIEVRQAGGVNPQRL